MGDLCGTGLFLSALATRAPARTHGDKKHRPRASPSLRLRRSDDHTRHLTDLKLIKAGKIDRSLNAADAGTHYCTKEEHEKLRQKLRNM